MKGYHYHAFISYSHSDSGKISYAVQKAIENTGRPWYRVAKKTLNVFRDETNLSANPSLWGNIETALQNADYFILLASPEAAQSKWVSRELTWWLTRKNIHKILIAVLDGNISWLENNNDFNWQKTNCLPAVLEGKFSSEPLYIDLRQYKAVKNHQLQDDAGFKSQVVKIIAAIINKPPREIFSDELKRKNNIQKLISAVVLVLLGLVAALSIMFLNVRRSYNTIQNQLAANLSNSSKNAIANNQLLLALHYSAQALINSKDSNLTRSLFTDIEPFIPQTCLVNSIYADTPPFILFVDGGKQLLTANFKGAISRWDIATGKKIETREKYKSGSYYFSPDGKRVLENSSYDGKSTILDVATGKEVGFIDKFNKYSISKAIFSADGSKIATISYDSSTQVWDAATGQLTGPSIKHQFEVHQIAFSPDEKKLLTTYFFKNTIRSWDVATGKQIGKDMVHEEDIATGVYSPDGKWILTASYDKTARIWDAFTGKQIGLPITHSRYVGVAVFSPDGKWIITACGDNALRKWNAVTRVQEGPAMMHEGSIQSVIFSPDGKYILTTSKITDPDLQESATTNYTRLATLWDAATGKQAGASMRHQFGVESADFSPDGKWIVTTEEHGTLYVWRLATERFNGVAMQHTAQIKLASFSPDGSQVLTATEDNAVSVWNIAAHQQIFQPILHKAPIIAAAFSPDGKSILTASGREVAVWSTASGKLTGAIITHDNTLKSASFSADGKWILTSCDNYSARLWDAGTHQQIGTAMVQPRDTSRYAKEFMIGAIFSPNGNQVLISSTLNSSLWDAATQKQLDAIHEYQEATAFSADGRWMLSKNITRATINSLILPGREDYQKNISVPVEQKDTIRSVVFSPDTKKLLTANRDGTARIWKIYPVPEYAHRAEQTGPSMLHHNDVNSAVFSPDGKRILTASSDSTACLWDVSNGKQVGIPLQHNGAVIAASFSSDGNKILTVSRDSSVRVWNIIGDADIPATLFQLQATVMTNSRLDLNIVADEIQAMDGIAWDNLKSQYNYEAKEHYKVCKYPEYNVWRRFHPEEAKKIKAAK